LKRPIDSRSIKKKTKRIRGGGNRKACQKFCRGRTENDRFGEGVVGEVGKGQSSKPRLNNVREKLARTHYHRRGNQNSGFAQGRPPELGRKAKQSAGLPGLWGERGRKKKRLCSGNEEIGGPHVQKTGGHVGKQKKATIGRKG